MEDSPYVLTRLTLAWTGFAVPSLIQMVDTKTRELTAWNYLKPHLSLMLPRVMDFLLRSLLV